MEVKEAIFKRRSIRKYLTDQIKKEDLELILNYGMIAPSACNKQPWLFYVINDQEKQEQVRHITPYMNILAPCYLIVCGDTKKAIKDFWVQDCSAAIENILIGAASLGLGTCWMGIYPNVDPVSRAQKILNVEEHIIPLGVIALGYPNENPAPRSHFDLEKIKYL